MVNILVIIVFAGALFGATMNNHYRGKAARHKSEQIQQKKIALMDSTIHALRADLDSLKIKTGEIK